jgi:hypothetical protein
MQRRHTAAAELQLHSFLTSALDEGERLMLRAIYSREITPVPTEQEAGGRFGEEKIILPLIGFESLTIQPEAQSPYRPCYSCS